MRRAGDAAGSKWLMTSGVVRILRPAFCLNLFKSGDCILLTHGTQQTAADTGFMKVVSTSEHRECVRGVFFCFND